MNDCLHQGRSACRLSLLHPLQEQAPPAYSASTPPPSATPQMLAACHDTQAAAVPGLPSPSLPIEARGPAQSGVPSSLSGGQRHQRLRASTSHPRIQLPPSLFMQQSCSSQPSDLPALPLPSPMKAAPLPLHRLPTAIAAQQTHHYHHPIVHCRPPSPPPPVCAPLAPRTTTPTSSATAMSTTPLQCSPGNPPAHIPGPTFLITSRACSTASVADAACSTQEQRPQR
jgi:hypothetical protein